jgi:hypothetical protein
MPPLLSQDKLSYLAIHGNNPCRNRREARALYWIGLWWERKEWEVKFFFLTLFNLFSGSWAIRELARKVVRFPRESRRGPTALTLYPAEPPGRSPMYDTVTEEQPSVMVCLTRIVAFAFLTLILQCL